MPIPTKKERDANLEALKKATEKWADKEIERLDNEARFMRAVVKGRTGSEELGALNLAEAAELVSKEINSITEIDSFIVFDGE
jgi:hypothetical protein